MYPAGSLRETFAAFVEDTCSAFRAMSVISSISSVGDAFPQMIFINHVRARLQHSKLGKHPASSHRIEVQAGNSQGLRQSMGTAQSNYDRTAGYCDNCTSSQLAPPILFFIWLADQCLVNSNRITSN